MKQAQLPVGMPVGRIQPAAAASNTSKNSKTDRPTLRAKALAMRLSGPDEASLRFLSMNKPPEPSAATMNSNTAMMRVFMGRDYSTGKLLGEQG